MRTGVNHAVRVHGVGDVRFETLPEPEPDPDEAVIEIAYGGICGSDIGYWAKGAAGESVLRDPMTLGHEVSGRVLRAAANGDGPDEGAMVTVHPATQCSYLGSAARRPHTDGGFAERLALPASMLRELPAGLDLRTAVLAEPFSVAWHAVRQAGCVSGRTAAVIGAGPIGSLTVAALRLNGASEITATDLHDFPLSVATALGASKTVLVGQASDQQEDVQADVVVESSGTPAGLESAIRAARRGGVVVLLGLQRAGAVPALMSQVITRELTLRGSFRFTSEMDEVLRVLGEGELDVSPVISHEFDARDAVAAMETARDAAASCKVILKFPPTA